jgi:hypothetical protein
VLHNDEDSTHIENPAVQEWEDGEWEVTVPCMTSVGESQEILLVILHGIGKSRSKFIGPFATASHM